MHRHCVRLMSCNITDLRDENFAYNWSPLVLSYGFVYALAGGQQPSILVFQPLHLHRTTASPSLSTKHLRIEPICRVFPNSVFLTWLLSGPGQES